MIRRQVTRTGKDKDGDITSLCNPGHHWSPRKKADAIKDIEGGSIGYFVKVGKDEVDVVVAKRGNTKYLRTDPDKTTKNNLEELPDC